VARFLWLTWDGAGNLPPSLGIARVLTTRGHSVSFAGRPEMVTRVRVAGFRTIELARAYEQVQAYPQGPFQRLACYVTSPAVAQEVAELVAVEDPDVAVVDCMFAAALVNLCAYGRPTAVMVHSFVHRALDGWRAHINRLVDMREAAGFGRLPGVDALWGRADRVIATTLREFDAPAAAGAPTRLRHVGPVLGGHLAEPVDLPWSEDDATPLVVISFSTGVEQVSVQAFQRALDAVAALPVHVVATTAGLIDAADLSVPANAVVLGYADHDALFPRASLLVTHGGHGTAMRALAHGLPAVLTPALAFDQPIIGATFEEWGCGRALPAGASAAALHDAVAHVLAHPSYRDRARARAAALQGVDGAAGAADELEALLPARPDRRGG